MSITSLNAQFRYKAVSSGAWESLSTWQKYEPSSNSWGWALTLPTVMDTVSFASGVSLTVSSNIHIGSHYNLYGTITISGGDTLFVNGTASLAGTINGLGTLVANAGSNCTFNNCALSTPTLVLAGGAITISGSPSSLQANLYNYGTVTYINTYSSNGTGTIYNHGNLICWSSVTFNNSFINYGIITSNSSVPVVFRNLTTTLSSNIILNAHSKLNIIAAVTPYTLIGNCSVALGATLEIPDASVTGIINFNWNLSGAGYVKFNSYPSTMYYNGSYDITGTTQAYHGTVTFTAASNIVNIGNIYGYGGNIVFNTGVAISGIPNYMYLYYSTITLNTGASYTFDSLNINNGGLIGSDMVVITKRLTCTDANFNSPSILHLTSTCTTNALSGTVTIDRPIINDGTINWGSCYFYGNKELTNNGVIRYSGSSGNINCSLNNTITGVVDLNGSDAATFQVGNVQNSGIINLITGGLKIYSGANNPTIGGSINVAPTCTLTLSNTSLSASIANAGTMECLNTNNFNGIYNSTGSILINNGSAVFNFNSGSSIPSIGTINCINGTLCFKPGAVPHGLQSTLSFNGKIEFSSGSTITFQNLSTGYYATLDGSDSIVVHQAFSHQGYMYGSGKRVLTSGCIGTLFNGAWISDTLINYGTLEWKDNDLKNKGKIINYNVFNISAQFNSNSGVTIENYGVINRSGSATSNLAFNYPVINNGTINLNAGINSFNGNTSVLPISGIINAAANTTVNFNSTNLLGTLNAVHLVGFSGYDTISGVYNNSGITQSNGATLVFKSTANIVNVGMLNCISGGIYFKPGAFIQAYSGKVYCGGLVDYSTGVKIALDTINIGALGTLQGTDSITIAGLFNHTGYLSGWGKKILLSTGTGMLSGNAWIGDSLYNYGSLAWLDKNLSNNGRIFNYNSFTLSPDNNSYCNVTIENHGTMRRTAVRNNTLIFNKPVINSTAIDFIGGIVHFNGNTTQIPLTGTINANDSTTLNISGASCDGSINASHIVAFSGNVNINGTFNNSGTTTNLSNTTNFNASANIVNVGYINCSTGSMYFKPGSRIQNLSGKVNCGGLIDFSTGQKISLDTVITAAQGTLHGTDSITIASLFNHTGYLNGSGKKILLAACTGTLSGNAWISDSLYNYGILTWTEKNINNYGRIFNYNIFNITSNDASYSYVTIENQGTINRSSTANATLTLSYPLLNYSSVVINSGKVAIGNNTVNHPTGSILIGNTAALQLYANTTLGGIISIAQNGLLTGSQYQCTFTGTAFLNNGLVNPGSLLFSSTSTLDGTGIIATPCSVTSSGHVTLASSHQLKQLTINNGGRFDIATYILYLNGSGNVFTNNGTAVLQSGMVEYNGTTAQTLTITNVLYGKVSVNNLTGVTLTSPWSYAGSLYLTGGTFNNGTNLTLLDGAVIYRSNGTIQNSPAVNGTIGIYYSANVPLTTGNEIPADSNALGFITIDDSADITLTRTITVSDSIVFKVGNLKTSSYQVILGPHATLQNETDSGYISGMVYVSRNLGKSPSDMGNIGCTVLAGNDSLGVTSILRTSGPGAAIMQNGNTSISRQWFITSEFQPSAGRDVEFTWPSADDNELTFAPDDHAEIWRTQDSGYASLWSTASVFGMQPRKISATNVNGFGTFTVALQSRPLRNYSVHLTAFIQGLYDGSSMNPDTVSVYFAEAFTPYNFVDSAKVLIDANGHMQIPTRFLVNGTAYYIILKHRNAIETWSANPIPITNYELTHDFTASMEQAFGSNLMQVGTHFCIYAGDVNQDGFVDFSDVASIDNDAYNFGSGYLPTDLNGDQFVDFTDLAICDNNAYNFVGVLSPLQNKKSKVNLNIYKKAKIQ